MDALFGAAHLYKNKSWRVLFTHLSGFKYINKHSEETNSFLKKQIKKKNPISNPLTPLESKSIIYLFSFNSP